MTSGDSEFIPSFGYWIRRRRKALDITQAELANHIPCALITIKKIELDERRPSRQMANRLALCLKIPDEQINAFIKSARAERATYKFPSPIDLPVEPDIQAFNNLPSPVTSFIGRKKEISQVLNLLSEKDTRLVSITGPGGVGKSRLAIEVCRKANNLFRDGIGYIPLASIQNSNHVVTEIIKTLKIPVKPGFNHQDILIDYLEPRNILLLLDNYEHLISSSPFIIDLLETIPGLKVLITSRIVLRLSGEHIFQLHPLGLSGAEKVFERIKEVESVKLFIDRARSRNPGFELNKENYLHIARICQDFDGLPLAIELVASTVKNLTPEEILSKLSTHLNSIPEGYRDLPSRHRTLSNNFDWSYELLNEHERCLFSQFGILRYGCSVEAVDAIFSCTRHLKTTQNTEEVLHSLIDHSLIFKEKGKHDHMRYFMLETIREYTEEKLSERGELNNGYRSLLQYLCKFAEASEINLWAGDQHGYGDRIEDEMDNIRSVLSWSLDNEDAKLSDIRLGAQLAGYLGYFWELRGYLEEGCNWLNKALSRSNQPTELRAKLLCYSSMLTIPQGEVENARKMLLESSQIYYQLKIQAGLADAMYLLGHVTFYQKKYLEARDHFQGSLDIYHSLGDEIPPPSIIVDLGMVAYHLGEFSKAKEYYQESLDIFSRQSNMDGIGLALIRLGDLARINNQFVEAGSLYEQCLKIFQEQDVRCHIAYSLYRLGLIAREQADTQEVQSLFKEGLAMQEEIGNIKGIVECLAGLAGLAMDSGNLVQSAHLFGSAKATVEKIGFPIAPADELVWKKDESLLKEMLGEATFNNHYQEGMHIPLSKAVNIALGEEELTC